MLYSMMVRSRSVLSADFRSKQIILKFYRGRVIRAFPELNVNVWADTFLVYVAFILFRYSSWQGR